MLNFVFIYYLKLGVVGSAAGTLTAMTVSVVLCVIYIGRKFPILRLRRSDWYYNPAFMREHLAVAVPMAVQFSVIALGLIIIQAVCNSFGSDVIAAFTSALRIEQVATSTLVALGFSVATYTAQNYGAGKSAESAAVSCVHLWCLCLLVYLLHLLSLAEKKWWIFLLKAKMNILWKSPEDI